MRDKEPMSTNSRCHRDLIVGLSQSLGSDTAGIAGLCTADGRRETRLETRIRLPDRLEKSLS